MSLFVTYSNMTRGSAKKKVQNEEEAMKIIAELKVKYPGETSKIMAIYKMGMDEGKYPEVRVIFLESATGGCRQTMCRMIENEKQGFGMDYKKKRTILNPAESATVYGKVVDAHNQGNCMGLTKITEEMNAVRSQRIGINTKPVSRSAARKWAREAGLKHCRLLTNYATKALSTKGRICKLYENLRKELEKYGFPTDFIFNMDESWVSTDGKICKEHVYIPEGGIPVNEQATIGKHVTLVACISLSCVALPQCYIIPTELKTPELVKKFHLENLKYFVQDSGFMTTQLLVRWIDEVFGPYLDTIRKGSNQMALLIVDPHTTRTRPEVIAALQRHRIRELILPAHVTSKFQPLDLVIFSCYKDNVRKNATKGPGGLYAYLLYSFDAFQRASSIMNIDSAWKRSRLFESDISAILADFPDDGPNKGKEVRCNMVVGAEDNVWV